MKKIVLCLLAVVFNYSLAYAVESGNYIVSDAQPREAAAVPVTPNDVPTTTKSVDTQPKPEVQTLPTVEVYGDREQLEENKAVGSSKRPEWTSARRFTNTRIYLQQEEFGDVGIEQWVKMQYPHHGKPNYLFEEEIEIGLGHRLQLDLYENWHLTPEERYQANHESFSIELRYAFADWGVIPLNPTLYAEYTVSNKAYNADKVEVKLLLGDSIMPRIHWGWNLVYERELGQYGTIEYSTAAGISYTVIDNKLSVGLEAKLENETTKGHRSPGPIELDIGPSIQWKPTKNTHFDIAPLFGVTGESPRAEIWCIFGYDFGKTTPRVEPIGNRI